MATPLLDQMKKDLLKNNNHIKRWLGRTDEFSWCAAQTAYAASRAGLLDKEIPKTTWAWKQAEFMKVKGRLYKYADVKNQLVPDCVMFFNKKKSDWRIDHVSIFEAYSKDKTLMLTVGGNEPDWSGSTRSSLRRVRQNYTRLNSDNPFFVGFPSYVKKPNARAYMGPLATDKEPQIKPTNNYQPLPVPPAPTSSNYPLIVLNPGHVDGEKRGFLGSETEGGNNRKTVAIIKSYLEENFECQIKVVQQPSTNFKKLGSAYPKAVLFYSHHTNAYSNKSAKGTEVFYHYGRTLAQNIAVATAKILNTSTRNTKSGDNGAKRNSDQFKGAGYAVINQAVKAGVTYQLMGEIGFHSNVNEARLMVEKRTQIGQAIAKEIAGYLKLKKKTKAPVSEPEIAPTRPKDPEKPPVALVPETPVVTNPNPSAPPIVPKPPTTPVPSKPPEIAPGTMPEPDPIPEPVEPYTPPVEPIPYLVVGPTPDPVKGPWEEKGQKLWFRVYVEPFNSEEEVFVFQQKLRGAKFYQSWYETLGKNSYRVIVESLPMQSQADTLVKELAEEGIKSARIYSLMLPLPK